jgi:xanthine dehydrogenase molybdopterin-binding subunit B
VAVAEPLEDGCVKVVSATQGLDGVQQAVAAVLGVPYHKVSVGKWRSGVWGLHVHYNVLQG